MSRVRDVDEFNVAEFDEYELDFDEVVDKSTLPVYVCTMFSEAERAALVTTFRDYDPDGLNTHTRLCNSLKRWHSDMVSS
jgi:hypothetical protein